ncbi:MAG: DUF1573 domain-containing protein [Planctomycetaceae bacterium]|nr:DUF1573 domain-containing protein [Planctomycetaceae bacterium]
MKWRRILSPLVFIALAIAVFVAPFLLPQRAFDVLHGSYSPMVCEKPIHDFGTVHDLESRVARFTIRNRSDQPVRILGSTCISGCIAFEGLPIVVAGRDSHDLTTHVILAGSTSGTSKFAQAAQLLFDNANDPMILTVKAIVVR